MTEEELLKEVGILAPLCGVWKGDKGIDIVPAPGGKDENPYFETITITPMGTLDNAKEQHLQFIHYVQIVSRKSDNEVFHHQVGYYHYDEKTNEIMESFVIPRGVGVVAGGQLVKKGDGILEFELKASADSNKYGIAQSGFMEDKAKTLSFIHKITLDGDKLSYHESTMLNIYGNEFDHTDTNELTRQ